MPKVFADWQCSKAILDFLAHTEVGRTVPRALIQAQAGQSDPARDTEEEEEDEGGESVDGGEDEEEEEEEDEEEESANVEEGSSGKGGVRRCFLLSLRSDIWVYCYSSFMCLSVCLRGCFVCFIPRGDDQAGAGAPQLTRTGDEQASLLIAGLWVVKEKPELNLPYPR